MDNKKRESYLDEQLEKLQHDQEADLLLDFDKALEEKIGKPYKIKYGGRIYEVPHDMPFGFSTFFFRYCYKKVSGKISIEVPEDRLMQFIELMFGKEFTRSLEQGKNTPINIIFDTLAMSILEKWGYSMKQPNNDSQKKI